MKKIILATAIIVVFAFGAAAQSDGFFNNWKDLDNRDENLPELPEIHGSVYNSNMTPIEGGLLILSTLGE